MISKDKRKSLTDKRWNISAFEVETSGNCKYYEHLRENESLVENIE